MVRLLVLTDRAQARRPLPAVVRAAVAGGARWIGLRERDLPAAERARLAAGLAAILSMVDGRLTVAGGPGDAVHLAAAEPVPVPRPALLGRSCHDAAEVGAARGLDYLTVSPVFPTRSKPGYGPPLGLAGLCRLAALAPVPVYALGGVTPGNAASCRRAGAAGVAVMGAVMRAEDPAALVRELLAAVGP